MAQYKTRDP